MKYLRSLFQRLFVRKRYKFLTPHGVHRILRPNTHIEMYSKTINEILVYSYLKKQFQELGETGMKDGDYRKYLQIKNRNEFCKY